MLFYARNMIQQIFGMETKPRLRCASRWARWFYLLTKKRTEGKYFSLFQFNDGKKSVGNWIQFPGACWWRNSPVWGAKKRIESIFCVFIKNANWFTLKSFIPHIASLPHLQTHPEQLSNCTRQQTITESHLNILSSLKTFFLIHPRWRSQLGNAWESCALPEHALVLLLLTLEKF